MQYYEQFLAALRDYFSMENWKKWFLQGGCFWFAGTLHRGIPQSFLMVNRMEEHCALYFEHGLYDVTGKISRKNFQVAGEKEIGFMRKNYIPKFDVEKLEKYLGTLGMPVGLEF